MTRGSINVYFKRDIYKTPGERRVPMELSIIFSRYGGFAVYNEVRWSC